MYKELITVVRNANDDSPLEIHVRKLPMSVAAAFSFIEKCGSDDVNGVINNFITDENYEMTFLHIWFAFIDDGISKRPKYGSLAFENRASFQIDQRSADETSMLFIAQPFRIITGCYLHLTGLL